jgi:hypothetical protein
MVIKKIYSGFLAQSLAQSLETTMHIIIPALLFFILASNTYSSFEEFKANKQVMELVGDYKLHTTIKTQAQLLKRITEIYYSLSLRTLKSYLKQLEVQTQ